MNEPKKERVKIDKTQLIIDCVYAPAAVRFAYFDCKYL